MNLEYFISSLPMLLEDEPAKVPPEGFAALCAEQLPPELAGAALEMLAICQPVPAMPGAGPRTAPSRHPFVTAWRDADTQLRNAIAAERARRRGDSSRPQPREASGCSPWLSQAVSSAFAAKDPLSREAALDSIRWRILDEMQGVSPFSEAAILAYAGKLALNARRHSISADAGMGNFLALTGGGPRPAGAGGN